MNITLLTNRIMTKYNILIPFLLLILVASCRKKEVQNSSENKRNIVGNWYLVNTLATVDSNDKEASSKIASSMESEMTVLKSSLAINGDDIFTVKSVLDSIVLTKDGKYTIDDNNITFAFLGQDQSTIKFTYQFEVSKDSLYIIFDNIEEIQSLLNNKTYSDSNLKLLYGIKDRNNVDLKSASIKRIYAREENKPTTPSESTNNKEQVVNTANPTKQKSTKETELTNQQLTDTPAPKKTNPATDTPQHNEMSTEVPNAKTVPTQPTHNTDKEKDDQVQPNNVTEPQKENEPAKETE